MCFVFYFAACDVIKDIQWSNNLDRIFKDNYQKDPTLSFQFFGSSTGFMRQFPGMCNAAMMMMKLCVKFVENPFRIYYSV